MFGHAAIARLFANKIFNRGLVLRGNHPTPADRFRGHLAISGHSGDTGGGCHDGDSTTTVTSGLGLETGTIDDESSCAGNFLIPAFFLLVIYKKNWGLLGTINSLIPGIDWGKQGNERVSPSGKPHGHTNQQSSKPLSLPLNWLLTNGILSSWIMTIPNNYVKGR